MRWLTIGLLALAAVAQAQESGTATENRSVLAALQRVEQAQKAMIVLQRIQIDEARLTTLEARRLQLLATESEWSKRAPSVSRTESVAGPLPTLIAIRPDGTPEVARTTPPPPVEASRSLNEVRRERQELETSIGALKKRIAAWEKRFEALLQAGVLPD